MTMGAKKSTKMTSNQAWNDFKKSVKKAKSDDESISSKLDVIQAQLNEINTDMNRVTDVVPQVLGELQAQDEETTDDIFTDGIEDPFMDEFDVFGEESDQSADEVSPEPDKADDLPDQNTEENTEELEEEIGEDSEPIEEEVIDTEEEDEIVEKMEKAISRLNTRLNYLEKQNRALSEKISQLTVHNVSKSYDTPRQKPIIRKTVGSVTKPPVSVSNGSFAKSEFGMPKPTFDINKKDDILAYCTMVDKQSRQQ